VIDDAEHLGEGDAPVRPALVPGVASALSPLVRRIAVPDPDAPGGVGTATYLVGIDEVAVIDPGPDRPGLPDQPDHVESIIGASMRERVRWVLATDPRPELSGAAARLGEATGALVLGPGGTAKALADGQVVEGSEFGVQAVAAPGPSPHHTCYLVEEERALICGALLGGPGAPLVDVAALRDTIARIQRRRLRLSRLLPLDGHVVESPAAALEARLAELDAVDAALLDRLAGGPARVDELTDVVPAERVAGADEAARVVLAHLQGLRAQGRVAGRDARSVWKPA
jgi:glyoxylase-like metal-dependent hydrolase (beta-lactamase superfamily II)